MTTNNDGLSPSRNKTGYVLTDDGFTEYGTIENSSDGSIGGRPHLFKFEFDNTGLIGCDCCTLNTNLVLLDSIGRVECNLIKLKKIYYTLSSV